MTQPTPTSAAASRRSAPQVLVAEVPSYAEAESLVDSLSDGGFPVQHTRIVGNGVHTVEYVTGRLTLGTATWAGAVSGAWFGLLVGIFLGLFATTGRTWLAVLLWGLILGALWGAVFGLVAQLARRGARDFSSVQALEADRYALYVDVEHSDDALRRLGTT